MPDAPILSPAAVPSRMPGSRERGDCTVRALATAAGIPYDFAYEIAKAGGRQAGRGANTDRVVEAAKRYGIRIHKVRTSAKTLRKFIALHPVGRFIVKKRGHALGVVDGVKSDHTRLGSIVRDAWEVLSTPEN